MEYIYSTSVVSQKWTLPATDRIHCPSKKRIVYKNGIRRYKFPALVLENLVKNCAHSKNKYTYFNR